MKESEMEYEKRLVTFIDILGFKKIVKQSEKDISKVELIYSVLDYLKNWEVSDKWDLRLVPCLINSVLYFGNLTLETADVLMPPPATVLSD